MANILKMEKKQAVLALVRLGWTYRRIEQETGVRRETVSKYALEAKAAKAPTGSEGENRPLRPPGRRSLCEEFRDPIRAKVEQGLDATRIHQDLVVEHGFSGGYDSVKRFCRQLKAQQPEVFARIEVPPGRELQVDFGKGALTRTDSGRHRRPQLFKAVLSHSRHSYEEVVWRQTLPLFIACLENALHDFQGVVETVRIDNLKAGVSRADFFDPEINPVLAAFARHYGFAVLPIRPRRPRENGKVERGVAYTQSNALKGRRFESLEQQNEHLRWWNRKVARLRVHGTTQQQVWKRFMEQERPALKPLPGQRFPWFHCGRRTVSPDGHVEVERAFYSVPASLLGHEVRVEWDERMVRIYHREQSVAVHPRRSRGGFQTHPEHLPEGKRWVHLSLEGRLLSRASAIGRETRHWAERALQVRGVLAYRLLQGVLSLTRRFPASAVEEACAAALRHETFRYRTLLELCKRRPPRQKVLFSQDHELIRPLSEYQTLLEKGELE